MCELAGVSRASFYRHWEEVAPSEAEMALREAVQQAALAHRFYGYRRVLEVRKEGYQVGGKRVRRMLRDDNLLAIRRRKFVATTDSQHAYRVYPNLAAHLELTDVNQLWVADLTYVRLQAEFVFLAVVLDAYSRRAVGWALGRRLDAGLALAALNMAIDNRHPQPGLLHHSDRGTQYASAAYVGRLESIQAVPSMSRAGRPWENGKCESFIKTLKQEEINARSYASLEELGRNVEEFMEQIYNRQRLHSALGYQSPEQFEAAQARGASQSGWRPAALCLPRYEECGPGEAAQ
jgi:transposase InsO family protein